MKAEIKLSIQPCFPHTARLMVIIRIHLMISLAECVISEPQCMLPVYVQYKLNTLDFGLGRIPQKYASSI